MPTHIQKSLHECLSKMKISNKQLQFPIRSCRRTKTSSFSAEESKQKMETDPVTLSDIDQFLFENFRSLYREEAAAVEAAAGEERRGREAAKRAAFMFDPPGFLGNPPPENLCRSARFFVADGSSSSSLMADESSESSSEAEEKESPAPEDFIALLTYSPSPYEDFRRSMQEMVDARVEHSGGKVDWEFLEELLFCYLDLNNKKSYRHILKAFVDLIVVLRENSGGPPPGRPSLGGGAWRRQLN